MNIPGKTPEQCRAHHEKSLKKYGRVDKIISQLLSDMEKKLKIPNTEIEPEIFKGEENYRVFGSNNKFTINIETS